MQKSNQRYYDLDQMQEISIERVLNDYGIDIKYGKFKLRNERTPSCKYYEKTNSYYDFGSGRGGSVIELFSEIEGCHKTDAIQMLGSRYGVRTLSGEQGLNNLSPRQYEMIGLYSQRAGMNWDFDLNQPDAALYAQSEQLGVTMNELRQLQPAMYQQIIKNRAIPYVSEMRSEYLRELYTPDEPAAKELLAPYSEAYQALSLSTKGTSLNVSRLKPDYDRDLEQVQTGKLEIDVGVTPYHDFKAYPGRNTYHQMPLDEYEGYKSAALLDKFQQDIPVAAFLTKGRPVRVVVKEQDGEVFQEQRAFLKHLEQTAEWQAAQAPYLLQPEL